MSATTFKLLVELPITLVQESTGTSVPSSPTPAASPSTGAPPNVFDEIFLRNPTTGGYIRVFADPSELDGESRILSQPGNPPSSTP